MFDVTLADYTAQRLRSEWIDEIVTRRWFKVFLPTELGGLQCTLPEGLDLFIESATIHGGLGWVVNLGSGASYFAGSFEESGAREIFSPERAVVAGSGRVGVARQVEGGHLISGEWDKCSGAAHATAFTVNAQSNTDPACSFTLLPHQVAIRQESHLFGLHPTSSWTICTHEAFVPNSLRFRIGVLQGKFNYPLHQIPFELFARFCMGASFIGMGHCLTQQAAKEVAAVRIESEVAQLNDLLISGRDALMTFAEKAWEETIRTGAPSGETDRSVRSTLSKLRLQSVSAASALFVAAGIRLSDERKFSHWAYRDLMTACHHFLLRA